MTKLSRVEKFKAYRESLEKNNEQAEQIKRLKAIINEKNNQIQHLNRELEYQKTLTEHIIKIKQLLEGKRYESL